MGWADKTLRGDSLNRARERSRYKAIKMHLSINKFDEKALEDEFKLIKHYSVTRSHTLLVPAESR